MRKGRYPVPGKLVLAVGLTAGLGAIGSGYAAWMERLSVRGHVTTGVFDMIFPADGAYMASVADGEGQELAALYVEVDAAADGKMATVMFPDGIPAGLLAEGNYIQLEFPLEPGEAGTFTDIRLEEPELGDTNEVVELTAESGVVMVDGSGYAPEGILEAFMSPLDCYVWRGYRREAGALTGSVTLQLTEESRELVAGMPTALALTAEELGDGEEAAAELEDGVAVAYSCQLELPLIQAEDGGGTEKQEAE